MMCKQPYQVMPGMYVACGSCLFCRINKARQWQHRILLEEMCWEESVFATLTYDEMFLPQDGSVDPRALQLFLKRLRRRMEPLQIRFYGVGEYGSNPDAVSWCKERPHYHLMLFGVGCEVKYCDVLKEDRLFSKNMVVEDSWSCGLCYIGNVTPESARYVTDYVTKYMNFEKSKKLGGRRPEFARMSNRPGIGAPAMRQVAATLLECGYSREKVVSELNYGKRKLPLDKYLKDRLHSHRGGDLIAQDRETRRWLDSVGIQFDEYRSNWCLSNYNGSPYEDVVGDSADSGFVPGNRHYHLAKSLPRRHTVEYNRKQFRKRRTL